jgi:hypothetical protein
MTELFPGVYVKVHIFPIGGASHLINLYPTKPTAEQRLVCIPLPVEIPSGFYTLEVGLLANGVVITEDSPNVYSAFDLSLGGKYLWSTSKIEDFAQLRMANADIFRISTKTGEVIYDGRSKGVLPPRIEEFKLQKSSRQKKEVRSLVSNRGVIKPVFSFGLLVSTVKAAFKRLAGVQREDKEPTVNHHNDGSTRQDSSQETL